MDNFNTALDLILPVNCNWFWLFIIGSGLATVLAWCWTYANSWENKYVDGSLVKVTYPVSTFLRGVLSVATTILALFFVVWFIYANTRPLEIETEEKLEIKPVVYPNGRVVQMFSCNSTNYNANTMFSSAPPDGSYVRRLIYKRDYCGVYFPPTEGKSSRSDTFILVTPDKKERQAENVTPDKE